MKRLLGAFASLRLTVVLFALSTFLVLAGTVAQIDKGIWTVVEQYFRCPITYIDFKIFFPRDWSVPGGIYYPGGWLIGALLLVNVLAAHAVRFRIEAHGGRLAMGLLALAAGAGLSWLVIAGMLAKDVAATEGDAFWRVLWRLAQGGGAALVLLIGCWLIFKRRAGIVLTHVGVIVLLISELVTGLYAVEGQMRIEQGRTVNWTYNIRAVEVAVIDHSDPDFDDVVAIPNAMLRRGGLIRSAHLPLDVEVTRFMKNSELHFAEAEPSQSNPATRGSGRALIAHDIKESSGVGSDPKVDIPSAYVRLKRRDGVADLGTYLVSVRLPLQGIPPQSVTVDGKSYELLMRFERTYRPYSLTLVEFRHDKYIGTEKPRNFSSLVRLVDEAKGVDRTVKIWMNNPLRYAGETFYQSSFEPGKKLTILQVVRNDGWMLPYLSCMIVGAGLSLHFGINLMGFLRKRAAV